MEPEGEVTDRNPDPTEWLEDSLYLGPAIREMDNHTGDGADRARAELATLKAKWERDAGRSPATATDPGCAAAVANNM